MKPQELAHFTKTLATAQKRVKECYDANTIDIGSWNQAGNLAPARRKAYNRSVERKHELNIVFGIRRVMLRLAEMSPEPNGKNEWMNLDELMYQFYCNRYGRDKFDYLNCHWESTTLGWYWTAIRHYIQENGTSKDQKLLLEKFTKLSYAAA
jgi:hypothetical protein